MRLLRPSAFRAAVLHIMIGIALSIVNGSVSAQSADRLTPIQQRVEAQRRRLNSSEIEERRDALMKLGAMKHLEASRAATSGLNDPDPIVRVTAAHAIATLPASEASSALIPLLQDKEEVVRREAAQALGATHSRNAVQPLINLLATEKEAGVRAAVVLALGQIADEAAVVPLAEILSGSSSSKKKSKTRKNEFLLRAAAHALGEIRSRAGVAILIVTLNNEAKPIDVRRSAAESLGVIGDKTAEPALKAAIDSADPYLSQAARAALRRLP
jgi:HEAT repeat protein